MMISYYLEAALVTIYFIVLFSARFSPITHPADRSTAVRRVVCAFRESVTLFLDASVIFAISMLAAGIARYVQYIRDPWGYQSVYALVGSVYMSAFSIFPTLVLQSVSDRPRRHWMRLLLWFLVIVSAVGLDVLYRRTSKAQRWDTKSDELDLWVWGDDVRAESQFTETLWLTICDPQDFRLKLKDILTVDHVILGFNVLWWIYILLSSLVPMRTRERWRHKSGRRRRRHHGEGGVSCWVCWQTSLKPALVAANAITCLVLMWCTLAYFHLYRDAVAQVAGDSNKDDEWTFGQVLALAAFAPVVVDLIVILLRKSI